MDRRTEDDARRVEPNQDATPRRREDGLGFTGREPGDDVPVVADDGVDGLGFTGRDAEEGVVEPSPYPADEARP